MNRRQPSIDGFIPRRPVSSDTHVSGQFGVRRTEEGARGLDHGELEAHQDMPAVRPVADHGLARQGIVNALDEIDDEQPQPPKAAKRPRWRPRLGRKGAKRLLLVVSILALSVGGYVGVRALIAAGNIFKGDLFGLVQSTPLKTDANGRSNVLVFGTSEDNYEGGMQHQGAYLTDSIMVVSVDQEKNDAYMVSIPRDLWVQYGTACNSGYEGKINEMFGCYSNDGQNDEEGAKALQKKISEVTGLDVQYYAHLNYTVVQQAVDAVGGVSVEIDSNDPRGVYDPNFDWRCSYQCNYVKYPNGPTGTIDGEHALALARARNAQGGYGLERGNFDREQYQQKIMRALVEKAVSVGTVTNVGKVTSLLDALGSNLRTNFETKEIRTVMRLAQDIPQEQMISIDLAKDGELAVMTDSVGGASVVRPVSGLYNFNSVKSYIIKQMSQNDPIVREDAKIGIYNGSGVAGVAKTASDELFDEGLEAVEVGNAPEGIYDSYELYDLTGSKSATKQKLEEFYDVTARSEPSPVSVNGLDFVIIVGRAPSR